MLEDRERFPESISEEEMVSAILYLDPDAEMVSAIRSLDADPNSVRSARDARVGLGTHIGVLTMLTGAVTCICLCLWRH